MFAAFVYKRFVPVLNSAGPAHHTKEVNRHHRVASDQAVAAVCLLTLLLLASAGTMAAESKLGPIHGSILNAQGQPVAFATVEVRDLHGIKIVAGVSDSSGAFAFSPIAVPGQYVLLVGDELWV